MFRTEYLWNSAPHTGHLATLASRLRSDLRFAACSLHSGEQKRERELYAMNAVPQYWHVLWTDGFPRLPPLHLSITVAL